MKKMISILLVFALCMSFGFNAFAANKTGGGSTTGGSSGTINVTTSLVADANTARATTKTDREHSSGYTVSTVVNYYYKNTYGQGLISSNNGTTSAFIGNVYGTGYKAVSEHTVRGGSLWGNWSGSLTVNVF